MYIYTPEVAINRPLRVEAMRLGLCIFDLCENMRGKIGNTPTALTIEVKTMMYNTGIVHFYDKLFFTDNIPLFIPFYETNFLKRCSRKKKQPGFGIHSGQVKNNFEQTIPSV